MRKYICIVAFLSLIITSAQQDLGAEDNTTASNETINATADNSTLNGTTNTTNITELNSTDSNLEGTNNQTNITNSTED